MTKSVEKNELHQLWATFAMNGNEFPLPGRVAKKKKNLWGGPNCFQNWCRWVQSFLSKVDRKWVFFAKDSTNPSSIKRVAHRLKPCDRKI